MKENFIATILFFFFAMIASGLIGEKLKRTVSKKLRILSGAVSVVIGVILIMPVYRTTGIKQILIFSVLIFFLNFGFIILLPEKGVKN
ncbi:MAG: hypothetical protein J7L03_03215 [Caldisericaceae bacterium]|nr:hypothetical protein [Caldisericaceae bacterium]